VLSTGMLYLVHPGDGAAGGSADQDQHGDDAKEVGDRRVGSIGGRRCEVDGYFGICTWWYGCLFSPRVSAASGRRLPGTFKLPVLWVESRWGEEQSRSQRARGARQTAQQLQSLHSALWRLPT
jgi:hypothetical protein